MTTPSVSLTVNCPHCGREVQLDEAMAHRVAAPMRDVWEAETRQQIAEQVRAAYARDLEVQSAKRKELEEELDERDGQIKQLRSEQAALLRERRQLRDEKEDLEREKERMRDEIRKQERADADGRAQQRVDDELRRTQEDYLEQLRSKEEEYGVRTRQLEDQLNRVTAQLEEAQRKSKTGSRQQDGLARQDLFCEELQRSYPGDLITATTAGKRGPDIAQVVRVGRLECGVILWECKWTAAWSPEWPRKLADAVRRRDGARFGVIVSEALPAGVAGSGRVGDVWVCDYGHARDLAAGLREAVITVYRHEVANAAREGTAGKVYDYFATGGFEARYKATEQAIDQLGKELDQDQRVSEQRWKRLERLRDEIREQGIRGILLDIISLGGEIPPSAQDEIPGEDPPELPAA